MSLNELLDFSLVALEKSFVSNLALYSIALCFCECAQTSTPLVHPPNTLEVQGRQIGTRRRKINSDKFKLACKSASPACASQAVPMDDQGLSGQVALMAFPSFLVVTVNKALEAPISSAK